MKGKMKKIRVAVIGCGALAQGTHLPNSQKNPRIDLVSACDINAEVAKTCAKKYGASRAETDWHKVVEADDVGLIVLATQHNLRGEIIIPALQKGKPVYTEKPLAPSRKEMREILRVSRETGVPVCVGHNRRSSPAILEFKRLLDKALTVKDVLPPSVDRSEEQPHLPKEFRLQVLMRINDDSRSWKSWIYDEKEGILFAEMVHFIDLAVWFNQSRPVRVFAEGSEHGNFTLIICFEDASITTIYHTKIGHFDYPKELFEATLNHVTIAMDQHIEIRQWGLKDEVNLKTFPYAEGSAWAKEQGMSGYMHELAKERKRAESMREKARWISVNKGHAEHLDRFLSHIEGKGENPCDIEGAIAVNMIALKLIESIQKGVPVEIGPVP